MEEKKLDYLLESLDKLEKEVHQLTNTAMEQYEIIKTQYLIIHKIKKYCLKTHMTIEEYETLIEMVGE